MSVIDYYIKKKNLTKLYFASIFVVYMLGVH